MTTYVTQPAVFDGQCIVSTDEIMGDALRRVPDFKNRPRALGFAESCGVAERRWFVPLSHVVPAPVEQRRAAVWPALLDAAEQAARTALDTAGITPREVGCLLFSNTTAPGIPGAHDELHHRLGLPPEAEVLPISPMLCGAGTRLLALASTQVTAHPGRHVLVVVVEAAGSMGYQPLGDTDTSMLVRLMFADSAGALVVRSEPGPGTCLALDPGWVRHTTTPRQDEPLHALTAAADGLHFVMTTAGARIVRGLLQPLLDWAVDGRPDWRPEALIVHPGGPSILTTLACQMPAGWPPGLRAEAEASYSTGNRSGVAVLDILARVAARQPAGGAPALLWSVAPGGHSVSATALTGRWHA